MQLLRKKFLTLVVTAIAAIAVVNISVQLATIIYLFPDVNVSSVLSEELVETPEDCSEQGGEFFTGLDLFFTQDVYFLYSPAITNSVGSFFSGILIPPHPYLDKVIPPPKG